MPIRIARGGKKNQSNNDGRNDKKSEERCCFVCNVPSNDTCGVCGEIYCSTECQVADWPQHRYVCFKMPQLVKGTPVTTSKRSMVFADPPKNNEDVVLTCVKSSNKFYIRSCANDSEYKKNAEDFDRYGKNGNNLNRLPEKNDVVLVKSGDKFVRAVIVEVISEDEIDVGLADIGRKEKKSLRDMRPISDELFNRKRFNFLVLVDGLPAFLPREQFCKLLAYLKTGVVFTLKYDGHHSDPATKFHLLKKDTGLPLEVYLKEETPDDNSAKNTSENGSTSSKHSLNSSTKHSEFSPTKHSKNSSTKHSENSSTKHSENSSTKHSDEPSSEQLQQKVEKKVQPATPIEQKNVSQPQDQTKNSRKVIIDDLFTETLPEVAQLAVMDVSLVEELGGISGILRENVSKLNEIHGKAEAFGMVTHEVCVPEPDELYLVQFENEWYRALYTPPTFLLVDYGASERIQPQDIRKFPADFIDPVYTFFCTIDGLKEDSKLKESLQLGSQIVLRNCTKVPNEPYEYKGEIDKSKLKL
ncbi:Protein vreteno [Pseudolycoriella hygida]|uniref:Protein vreteno n=1 Tax=Pseudolycoriella hygida TaxID=35572 RepID=A0A9Q0NHN3_9DIPT|nr:Protein vreteno [Pseudolycoriella hygida]